MTTKGGPMSNVPEGAQLSDDGQWWWDGAAWQAVSQQQGAGGDANSGDDRAAARAAQGLPASLTEITDDQRKAFIGEPTVVVEQIDADQTEVLAMQDNANSDGNDHENHNENHDENSNDNGTAMA